MFKVLLLLLAGLLSTPALAQSPTCPTRPNGNSTNACASTAFVQNAFGGGSLLTLPNGQILIGNASNKAAAAAVSGDCSLTNLGVLTCTKTNGVAFGPFATAADANTQISHFNSGTSASGSTFWRGDGTWSSPPATSPTITHIYYANQLSTYGLGLTNFACNSSTDDAPAWNAFMAATWNGTIPAASTLSFEGYDRTTFCRFLSRPAQWGNALKIIGNPWFLRDYQPGSITQITNTSNVGGSIAITVPSTGNVGLPVAVVKQPVRAVFTGSASGTAAINVTSITSGVLQVGMYVMDSAGTSVLGIIAACPTVNCNTTGSYTTTSAVTFGSQTLKGRMYYIGVTGVLGTTEANGLWVPNVLNSTTIQLLQNTQGAFSVYTNSFSGSFVINTATSTTGGILLGVSAGASALHPESPVTSVNIGGIPGANGLFPATATSDTTVVLQGAVFSGSYSNPGGGVLYSGSLITQPLEPFIELGPQSDTDHMQSEPYADHLLIYTGCNWGGVGFDIGSHNINGSGYGDVTYSVIDKLGIVGGFCGGSSQGNFGVFYRVDGSNSPGIPEGAFSGNRLNRLLHYFSGAGLWYGIWLRSASSWSGVDITDQGSGIAYYAGLYLDGPDTTMASYLVHISGQAMGHRIVFGPNANTAVMSFASTDQVFFTGATNSAINMTIGFCNSAPSFSAGPAFYVLCNGTVYHQ